MTGVQTCALPISQRPFILKFDGCYHGHVDYLLAAAGSGVADTVQGKSPGVPADFTKYTLSLPFNRPELVEQVFKNYGSQLAAVIVEPVPANMGVVMPGKGFLQLLRNLSFKYGVLLVFDEVITGFRISSGGAQKQFGIMPDLTTLGKIVGGGFPAGAFGGSKEIMTRLAPVGNVYQAGTLSGNPVAMTAGYHTLELLGKPGFYEALHQKSGDFYTRLHKILNPYPVILSAEGSMFTIFFRGQIPSNFEEVHECNMQHFATFYRFMLQNGVYLSPSQYEASFITGAHSQEQLNRTLILIEKGLKKVFN